MILLAGLGLMMASCETQKNTADNADYYASGSTNILNTAWVLDSNNVATKKPTMVLEHENISGNGGCNNYTGYLKVDTKTRAFSASKLASTRMACKGTNEASFLKMLEQANNYKIKGNQLHLYKDNLLLLKFNRK